MKTFKVIISYKGLYNYNAPSIFVDASDEEDAVNQARSKSSLSAFPDWKFDATSKFGGKKYFSSNKEEILNNLGIKFVRKVISKNKKKPHLEQVVFITGTKKKGSITSHEYVKR